MPVSEPNRKQIFAQLEFLYGDNAASMLEQIDRLVDRQPILPRAVESAALWDEKTVVLITYGDQVEEANVPALQTLQNFLLEHGLHEVLDAIHLLPIFPYSSDDGFSVIDYRQIRPDLGDWQDVETFGGVVRSGNRLCHESLLTKKRVVSKLPSW